MAATDLAIRIATTLDASGINRADKAIGKLQKSVRTFSKVLGGVALASFAKKSLSAFIADELAATKLTNAVKNLGLEFANPYISDYIANLEKTSQVADDELRPAFQRLLQQTGSLAKSQSILNTAIEVSRGTGESLASVSEDLAKAYYGNTKGLQKYSLGLTKVELQTKSFAELQDILTKKFQGSNAAYLGTYAGQLNILSLAWGNLQENAGKALFTLAGANGDQSSGARRLGGVIDAFGVGLIEAAKLFNNAFTAFGQAYFGFGDAKPEAVPAPTKGQELFRKSSANDAKLKAIEAQQAKLYKQQLAATKALTAEQKRQALLKKAGSIFDLEQIQLIAALKGNLSEEERKRVELQFALLTGNTKEAQLLTYELAKAQGLGEELSKYLASLDFKNNPFASWSAYLDDLMEKAQKLAMMSFSTQQGGSTARGADFAAQSPIVQSLITNATGTNRAGVTSGGDVYVSVQGSVVSSEDLVAAIENGLQVRSLSGSNSVVGRIAGMFG